MSIDTLLPLVNALSEADKRELRDYLNNALSDTPLPTTLTPAERMALVKRGMVEGREVLSNAEYAILADAVNLEATTLTPADRVRLLNAGFAALRDGLTSAELEAMTDAMNAEYVEPWDATEWQD